MTITPTQSNVLEALGQFIAAVVPGLQVIVGQQNRTAEPHQDDFVVMTPIRNQRLATNIDGGDDCKFIGSIAGNILTVEDLEVGAISPGVTVFGPTVQPSTTVLAAGDLPSTFTVSISQTVPSGTLSAGQKTVMQETECVVQLDFHSADTTSADAANTVSTALRDEFGTSFFAGLASPLNGVSPLYADDPRQMPFMDAEQQYEWRWVLEAHLQYDPSVAVPQQYGDGAQVQLVDVDASFPP